MAKRKQKLTPFFPPEVKPVHVGVYHATMRPDAFKGSKSTFPQFRWNGQEWWNDFANRRVMNQHRYWRGLS